MDKLIQTYLKIIKEQANDDPSALFVIYDESDRTYVNAMPFSPFSTEFDEVKVKVPCMLYASKDEALKVRDVIFKLCPNIGSLNEDAIIVVPISFEEFKNAWLDNFDEYGPFKFKNDSKSYIVDLWSKYKNGDFVKNHVR